MDTNQREYALAFAQFIPTSVKLDELQKMTDDLDDELAESQKIMKEIKSIFDNASKVNDTKQDDNNGQQDNNAVKQEDMTKFLEADVPKLLMSDMPNVAEKSVEDLDDIIASMKSYAEDLQKNIITTKPQQSNNQGEFENLKQYATNFEQLAKRLANIKFNKKDEANNRNAELEVKLTQLCHDVNLFTQMVQTKTAISGCNKNLMENQQESNALFYDNIINKLLTGINEVTYLLKSKN